MFHATQRYTQPMLRKFIACLFWGCALTIHMESRRLARTETYFRKDDGLKICDDLKMLGSIYGLVLPPVEEDMGAHLASLVTMLLVFHLGHSRILGPRTLKLESLRKSKLLQTRGIDESTTDLVAASNWERVAMLILLLAQSRALETFENRFLLFKN